MENPMPEQVETPEGGCDPMGSQHWSKLLTTPLAPWREEPTLEQVCWQDFWPHGGPMLEQSVPEGLHPMGETHAGAVHEELQPMGRTHIGEVHGGLSPVRGTPRWSRGRV
ncbi:EH domain-containing protein 4 [Grus japonensis]|uniref:EH domain-containing protein 4 n=1 Tax=Grus japonensis TaxID=30415 RepID=A0ABC9W8B5_GRUJA